MLNPIVSQVFCCGQCGAPVALIALNADDLGYQCQNARCGKVVSVDCPEALGVMDELVIELPTLVYEVA